MTQLERLIVRPGMSIIQTMAVIDEGASAIALVVDPEMRLIGTVSDGDLRRALLSGASLEDSVDGFVSRDPTTVPEGSDRAAVLDLMRARQLSQIPVVDDGGCLVGLHVIQEVLGGEAKPNCAVVLAGGRGTRLGNLTNATPKPMLHVAGRPILERIVLHLVGSGVRTVYLAVNYLAEQVENHFGDGSDFGCEIWYLREDADTPLGTGGPLRRVLDVDPTPSAPLLVMNGDLVTSFSVRSILEAHRNTNAVITVALKEYAHEVPFGVAKLDEGGLPVIRQVDEKPRWSGLVNAGIYVVEPRVLKTIPRETTYPITDLISSCIAQGEVVAGWELTGEWHDIGRPQEFARARGEE